MPTDPRAAAEAAARDLLRTLEEAGVPPPVRVTEAGGRLACLVLVWDTRQLMPTAKEDRRTRDPGRRARCKAGILAVLGAAARPLTRKEVIRGLEDAGKDHREGTVAKALADLTASQELVNARDGPGYWHPAEARRRRTPSLF